MTPVTVMALLIIASLAIGTIVTICYYRLILYVGTWLKRRNHSQSFSPQNCDYTSNRRGTYRQQCNQEVSPTYGIKEMHHGYYFRIVGLIDRVVNPVRRKMNIPHYKQHEDTKTTTKYNERNLTSVSHTDKSSIGETDASTKRESNHYKLTKFITHDSL